MDALRHSDHQFADPVPRLAGFFARRFTDSSRLASSIRLRGRLRFGFLHDLGGLHHLKIHRFPDGGEASMIRTLRKGRTFPDYNFRATAQAFIYSELLVYLAILWHAATP